MSDDVQAAREREATREKFFKLLQSVANKDKMDFDHLEVHSASPDLLGEELATGKTDLCQVLRGGGAARWYQRRPQST